MAPKKTAPPSKPAPSKAALSKATPSKTAPAAGSDAAQPPSSKKALSSKQKECVRQVKGLFTLTGPINLNIFFPGFVIGEIIFKEGFSELDPCLFKSLQELLPYRQALICACAVLLSALVASRERAYEERSQSR